MAFSCIIIDDEPNAVKLLEMYISKTNALELKGVFYDGIDALDFFKKGNTVDVVFSDINMPLLSGLDLAELLPATQKFIFTTAYSEHAVSSFSFLVVDYLLKPITLKRFQQALLKLEHLISETTNLSTKTTDFTYIKNGKQLIKLTFSKVLYIAGAKEYVDIHTSDGHFLVYKRLKEIETILPSHFIRVHNSYIINSKCIERMNTYSILIAKKEIPIGDSYKDRLKFLWETN